MAIQNIQAFSYDPAAQYLFRRAYALAIGAPGQTSALQYANFEVPGVNALQRPSPLRIRFEVERTLSGSPAKAKIDIFNMSQASRQSIKKGFVVKLSVGYNGLMDQLFLGNVADNGVKSNRNGPDIITTLECGDGESAIVMTILNKTYPPGTYLAQVIRDIAREMRLTSDDDPVGLEGGSMLGVPEFTFTRGLAIEGTCANTLDTLLKPQGLRWCVTNGALIITPAKSPNSAEAILVSSETGMIGVPSNNSGQVEFSSLLNPKLIPGALVQLKSQNIDVNGFYKVMKANYGGDTHDSRWDVKCQGIPIDDVVSIQQPASIVNFGGLA